MMGKPKTGNGKKDGQHLLVQVSGTDSEVQEFQLPPRRTARVKPKKATSRNSDNCCRDFTRILFVLMFLAMLAGIGFLGFVYYKLNAEVADLKTAQTDLKSLWDSKGEMASKVNEAAKAKDLKVHIEKHKKQMDQFDQTLVVCRTQLTKVNSSVAHLNTLAKDWEFVLDKTGQLQKVGKEVGELTQEVTKMVSNVEEVDDIQRKMKQDLAQLKTDSTDNKKRVTDLGAALDLVKTDVQHAQGRLDGLEHSHSELELRTSVLTKVNVTKMDADMQTMSNDMQQISSVVDVLQATASSGQRGANLTSVMTKLEEINDGVMSTTASVQSLNRRLSVVEKVERHHQDQMKGLVNVTKMDAEMQTMSNDMQQISSVVDMLKATASSGQREANLTSVITKLEEINDGVMRTTTSVQALNRRLSVVEEVERHHQDQMKGLVSIINGINTSLAVIMDGQGSESLVKLLIHNLTSQIEAEIQGYAASLDDLKFGDSQKPFNISAVIHMALNQALTAVGGPEHNPFKVVEEGMTALNEVLLLQNATIARLQQELQQVRMSLWQLRAKMTAQEAASKLVEPTEDKPNLPTETRNNKTSSHTTEMAANHTTTGAVIEDVPVTEKIKAQPGTSKAPVLKQTGSNTDVMMTTGAGEETEAATVHPLTTDQGEYTEQETTRVPSTATPIATAQQKPSSLDLNRTVPSIAPEESANTTGTPSQNRVLLNNTVDVDEEISETDIFGTDKTDKGTAVTATGKPLPSGLAETESPLGTDEEPTKAFETEQPLEATGVPSNDSDASNAGEGTKEPPSTLAGTSSIFDFSDNGGDAGGTAATDTIALNVTKLKQDEAEEQLSDLGQGNREGGSIGKTRTTEGPSEKAIPDGVMLESSKVLGMFDKLDKDGDNQLSREELVLIIPEKRVDQYMDAVDENNDQHIDRGELSTALEEKNFGDDDDIAALLDDNTDATEGDK